MGETPVVPEDVTDKVQVYPTPKNVNNLCRDLEALEDFYFLLGSHRLYCLVKKGHLWNRR